MTQQRYEEYDKNENKNKRSKNVYLPSSLNSDLKVCSVDDRFKIKPPQNLLQS